MYLSALTIYRIAHRLAGWHVPLLPNVLDGLLVLLFNSTIRHTAEIGKSTVIAHRGMSVGIHAHAKIGERVFIGIHAVIGGRAQDVGPPVIEDDVFIGINAVVLCSRVGKGAIIGAGAIVLEDVPPGAVVAGNPAKVIKTTDKPWWDRKTKDPREVAAEDTVAEGSGNGDAEAARRTEESAV
jgi:serine O-acetyltransferase